MSAFNVSVSIDVGGHKETFYGQLDKRSAKQLRTQLKELCRRAIHRQPIELPSPETSPSSSPSSTPLTPIEESKQDVEEEVSSPQEQGDQRPRVWIYDIEQPIISRRARRSGSSKCNMLYKLSHPFDCKESKVDEVRLLAWWKEHRFQWKCINPNENRYAYRIEGCRILRKQQDIVDMFDDPNKLSAYKQSSTPGSPTPKKKISPKSLAKVAPVSLQDELIALSDNPKYVLQRMKELDVQEIRGSWRMSGVGPLSSGELYFLLMNCPPVAVYEPPNFHRNYSHDIAEKRTLAYYNFQIFKVKNKYYTPERRQVKSIVQALNSEQASEIQVKGDELPVKAFVLSDAPHPSIGGARSISIPGVQTVRQWVEEHRLQAEESTFPSPKDVDVSSESKDGGKADAPQEDVDVSSESDDEHDEDVDGSLLIKESTPPQKKGTPLSDCVVSSKVVPETPKRRTTPTRKRKQTAASPTPKKKLKTTVQDGLLASPMMRRRYSRIQILGQTATL